MSMDQSKIDALGAAIVAASQPADVPAPDVDSVMALVKTLDKSAHDDGEGYESDANNNAYAAVESAITALVQERDRLRVENVQPLFDRIAELEQGQDALKKIMALDLGKKHVRGLEAAALAAPPAPTAQPLSDEQIRNWWGSDNGLEDCDMCKVDDFTQVVRAIERHHGIGFGYGL